MNKADKNYDLNKRQVLYIRYLICVLVDLTILNLYTEYWDYVVIDSFTISFFAAILLQLLLRLSIKAENMVSNYFKSKPGKAAKVYRVLSILGILSSSKIVILQAIVLIFDEQIEFYGPLNGLITFIIVIITIIVTELILSKIFWALSSKNKKSNNT